MFEYCYIKKLNNYYSLSQVRRNLELQKLKIEEMAKKKLSEIRQLFIFKGGRPDLNRRPPEPQSGVLTN